LRLRPTLQPRLPIDLRLASSIHLRLCLPTSTSNPSSTVRSFSKSSGPFSSLRLQPTFRPNLPAGFRLASPANFPVPLSSRPATVAACRSSSHALQSPSSLRLPSIFRLNLPANLIDLRLLVDLPALPTNLTSDSRRRSHPLALPSSQSATVAADQPSGPACGPTTNAYRLMYPYGAALRSVFDLRLRFPFRPCLRNNFHFTGC